MTRLHLNFTKVVNTMKIGVHHKHKYTPLRRQHLLNKCDGPILMTRNGLTSLWYLAVSSLRITLAIGGIAVGYYLWNYSSVITNELFVMLQPVKDSIYNSMDDTHYEASQHRIPNVLVAGVQKSGTSTIYSHLLYETKSCWSQNGKESNFFHSTHNMSDLKAYQKLFTHCHGGSSSSSSHYIIGDATPDIFVFPKEVYELYHQQAVARNDMSIINDLKIIISLREPVDRELSVYYHRRRDIQKTFDHYGKNSIDALPQWLEPHITLDSQGNLRPFEQVVNDTLVQYFNNENGGSSNDADGSGSNTGSNSNSPSGGKEHNNQQEQQPHHSLYAHYLEQWFHYFDRKNQILIVSFDELNQEPTKYKNRIRSFLNATSVRPLPITIQANSSPRPPPQPLSSASSAAVATLSPMCAMQQKLAKLFDRPNQKLYQLLEDNPGPNMEQRPFPKFQYLPRC
jgi:Sulfotransferase domain